MKAAGVTVAPYYSLANNPGAFLDDKTDGQNASVLGPQSKIAKSLLDKGLKFLPGYAYFLTGQLQSHILRDALSEVFTRWQRFNV
jgi:hypothetical protein